MLSDRQLIRKIKWNEEIQFSVETAGHFDLDAELKIWISGAAEPAQNLQFCKDRSINEIQQALAAAILK